MASVCQPSGRSSGRWWRTGAGGAVLGAARRARRWPASRRRAAPAGRARSRGRAGRARRTARPRRSRACPHRRRAARVPRPRRRRRRRSGGVRCPRTTWRHRARRRARVAQRPFGTGSARVALARQRAAEAFPSGEQGGLGPVGVVRVEPVDARCARRAPRARCGRCPRSPRSTPGRRPAGRRACAGSGRPGCRSWSARRVRRRPLCAGDRRASPPGDAAGPAPGCRRGALHERSRTGLLGHRGPPAVGFRRAGRARGRLVPRSSHLAPGNPSPGTEITSLSDQERSVVT